MRSEIIAVNWNEKSIERFRSAGGQFVRCRTCTKHPEIIKRYAYKQQIPSIATEAGARYRTTVLENHFACDYHKESVKAERIKLLEVSTPAPMDISINRANKKHANHIAKLLIQVYTDAKRLILTAWNWPARYVAAEVSHVFSFENHNEPTVPENVNLQYVNPRAHLELMSCIVETDISVIKTKLEESLAISLRIDGSVDRTRLDKIYVNATELLFFGVDEQVERKATGLLKTALSAMENLFGRDFLYNVILKKTSSICTDGTNVNIGEEGGIWKFLADTILEIGSEIPLVKIWCSAHRSDLAFKDLSKAVPETDKILTILILTFPCVRNSFIGA